MNTIRSSLLLFLLLFLNSTCLALSNNSKDPISIESNTLELDQKQGQATYLGNVVLKQNGKELIADKMIIFKNAQGKLEKVLAFGKPAKYMSTVKEDPIFGEANKITFLPAPQDMILENQAKLTQKQDSFSAPYITYNFQTKIIRSKSQEGIRPTIIFHPS
jgi:lipopolysaccharide export system protein LptA